MSVSEVNGNRTAAQATPSLRYIFTFREVLSSDPDQTFQVRHEGYNLRLVSAEPEWRES